MNQREYEELEKRIEDRNRIKAMVSDMEKSKKETIAYRDSEAHRAGKRGDKFHLGEGGGTGHANSSGGAFERTQIQFEG